MEYILIQMLIPFEKEVNGFQYFKVEPILNDQKPYRLILVIEIFDDYLGVINAFRVNRRKNEKI